MSEDTAAYDARQAFWHAIYGGFNFKEAEHRHGVAMDALISAVRADERAKYEALVKAGRELRYWLTCLTDTTDMRLKSSRAVKEWDDLDTALHQQGGQ